MFQQMLKESRQKDSRFRLLRQENQHIAANRRKSMPLLLYGMLKTILHYTVLFYAVFNFLL